MGVVGREHRIERIRRGQQATRASQISDVGVPLAGEHRVAGKTELLRALDLTVPVRPLDQAHRNPPAMRARQRIQPFDHERRTLLERLHRQPEPVPIVARGIGEDALEQVHRQFEALGLLGIEGEPDAMIAGDPQQMQQAWRQLPEHPRPLRADVARMQRRELHRNPRPREHTGLRRHRRARADRNDRLLVGVAITGGVTRRQRRLTEHVE